MALALPLPPSLASWAAALGCGGATQRASTNVRLPAWMTGCTISLRSSEFIVFLAFALRTAPREPATRLPTQGQSTNPPAWLDESRTAIKQEMPVSCAAIRQPL